MTIDRTGGKPRISGAQRVGAVRFNVSHAGRELVVALTRGREVGIDAEPSTRSVTETLERHAFTEWEREALASGRAESRSRFALRLWVAKEALLKAAGVGLAVEPGAIELGWDDRGFAIRSLPSELGPRAIWELVEVPLDGLVVVLALERRRRCGPGRPVVHDRVGCR